MSSADVFDGDPHEELGVDVGASLGEIKKAYRRLAAKWHPDRNSDPQAVRRMQRINHAYRRLCEWLESGDDDDASAPPDEPAAPPKPAAQAKPQAKSQPKAKKAWWERNWGFGNWEADGQAQPQTVQAQAHIDLESAAFGCTHQLKGLITDLCDDCAGVGRMISPKSSCSVCHGEGHVQGGAACDHCGGDGVDRKPCDTCGGSGQAAKPRDYHFEVRIPPGMPDGQMILLRQQGQRCGDLASDIELTVRIKPHPIFQWDEDRVLACTVPVDLFTVLGEGTVEVPTLDGHLAKVSLADGMEQSLQDMGFPKRDGKAGPLRVRIQTVSPQRLSAQQRAWLKQLADSVRADEASCPEVSAWQRQLKTRSR